MIRKGFQEKGRGRAGATLGVYYGRVHGKLAKLKGMLCSTISNLGREEKNSQANNKCTV